MRIIGIDPGLNCTGWGIIHVEGQKVNFIAADHIKTNSKKSLRERLHCLYQKLSLVIEQYGPSSAAIEETFVNKNPRSSLSLCHARGALILTCAVAGINDIHHYPANHIKKTVTGNGHADKHQMINILRYIVQDIDTNNFTHDVADAVAIALCHAYCLR